MIFRVLIAGSCLVLGGSAGPASAVAQAWPAAARQAAIDLVLRYVAADTAASEAKADALLPPGCEHDMGADFIAPTIRVALLPAVVEGDTLALAAVYHTIGRLFDQSSSQARSVGFDPLDKTDTTRFLVVPGAGGRPALGCPAYLPSNRWGLSAVQKMISAMDSASRRRWQAALQAAKRP